MTLDRATLELLEDLGANSADLQDQLNATNGPAPQMMHEQSHVVPDATAPVNVLVPIRHPRAVLVWFHGWSRAQYDSCPTIGRKLAERMGCTVVLVGCSRDRVTHHAAVTTEAWAALDWVAATLATTDEGPLPIIVAGQGTGAHVAALLAQRSVRDGGPEIALQVLICPVTDARTDRPSYQDPARQMSLTGSVVDAWWAEYLPDVKARNDLHSCPILGEARVLAALPPTVLMTAEHDPLHDEGIEYGDALVAAGVSVDRRDYVGQLHGFFTTLVLPGSERGFQQVVKAVGGVLARESQARAVVSR